MKNPQNITIVLLLATAAILGTMLLASYQDNVAYAGGPAIKSGQYLMAQGEISNSLDLIYVLDIGSGRLNVYYTNINSYALELVDSIDLARAFASAEE